MYIVIRYGRPIRGLSGLYLSFPTFGGEHFLWKEAKEGPLDALVDYFERKWARSQPLE